MILVQTLSKVADALSKHGGAQVGYRLASARQELQVDRQPSLPAVKDYAEFLQAEAEDLALMASSQQGTAKGPSTTATSASAPQASVKAFGGGGVLNGTDSREKKQKQACRCRTSTLSESQSSWWALRFPEVPPEALKHMVGTHPGTAEHKELARRPRASL